MKLQRKVQLSTLLILVLFTFAGCNSQEPIRPESSGFFNEIIILFTRGIIYLTNVSGEHFWVGIVGMTILTRIIIMPTMITSQKTSVRMQKAQPEIERITKKYEGKNDRASMDKKNQETMQVYSKYQINPLSSCLSMFLLLPIFTLFYSSLRRLVQEFPGYSKLGYMYFEQSKHWNEDVFMFFGIDLSEPSVIMSVIAIATMIGSSAFITLTGTKKVTRQQIQMLVLFSGMYVWMYFGPFKNQPAALFLYLATGSLISIITTLYVRRRYG